jgi:hypothetical protein
MALAVFAILLGRCLVGVFVLGVLMAAGVIAAPRM